MPQFPTFEMGRKVASVLFRVLLGAGPRWDWKCGDLLMQGDKEGRWPGQEGLIAAQH